MPKCTATDKPKIAILMAVYNPRLDWLKEQLTSLDQQTYPNLELYIRDDCSPKVPYEEIAQCVQECITAFPVHLVQNEKNLGSNLTFEKLTVEAEGNYFAYCDQDDIWLPHKLETLADRLAETKVSLACSDMYVIDGTGKTVANSITEVRRHHRFQEGEDLTSSLLVTNFVTGCTMMMGAALAKEAVPFCPYMVHDHYLALYASKDGEIATVQKPLIQYRIHQNNQTLDVAGVTDKASYCRCRIDLLISRVEWLQTNGTWSESISQDLENTHRWAVARKQYFTGKIGQAKTIWQLRQCGKMPSYFELLFAHLPTKLFMYIIERKRKNQI